MMIETGEIKEFIKRAEESVESMNDEKLKLKAFEVVLNNLMKPSEGIIISSEKIKSEELNNKEISMFSKDNLLNNLELSETQLNNIVEFDGDNFRILPPIKGKSEGEKQKKASLIILTNKYYCYGAREIETAELRNNLQDMGIKSLKNMATHLKNFENYIIKKGKPGSSATLYRITDPGLKEGLRLIKELGANYE